MSFRTAIGCRRETVGEDGLLHRRNITQQTLAADAETRYKHLLQGSLVQLTNGITETEPAAAEGTHGVIPDRQQAPINEPEQQNARLRRPPEA